MHRVGRESNTIKFYHRVPLVGASSAGWWRCWAAGAGTLGRDQWPGGWAGSAGTTRTSPACTRARWTTGGSPGDGDLLLLHLHQLHCSKSCRIPDGGWWEVRSDRWACTRLPGGEGASACSPGARSARLMLCGRLVMEPHRSPSHRRSPSG